MLVELIFKGGPVMIPIILLSLLPLPSFSTGSWPSGRFDSTSPGLPGDVLALLEKGELQKALERCDTVRHPIGVRVQDGHPQPHPEGGAD